MLYVRKLNYITAILTVWCSAGQNLNRTEYSALKQRFDWYPCIQHLHSTLCGVLVLNESIDLLTELLLKPVLYMNMCFISELVKGSLPVQFPC